MKRILLLLALGSCTSLQPSGTANLNNITVLARDSACAKISWTGRGIAPLGYTKGMAFAFAKSYCKKRLDGIGGSSLDALVNYGITPTDVVNTYALLTGLGMRESSGNYCEGRDTTASNTSSDTAEAGPFQTSWNAHTSQQSLTAIFNEYKADTSKCFLDVWQEGVSQSHCNAQGSYFGSGDGLAFQKLARSCPAFATEFAAVTIRVLRTHYGPISRREVSYKQECVDMFTKIKAMIDADSSYCSLL